MGAKTSKTTVSPHETEQLFKLFEYQCSSCKSKRPIQYFYRNGKFLPQTPRVVCGQCNTSSSVQPFKTVDYGCPTCKKGQKARMPGKPIPLNMYNMSVVACTCGFKGEVGVGRLMDVACSHCWHSTRLLCDVWIEESEELKTFCPHCQECQRAFASAPKKKGAEQQSADLEYCCNNCFRVRPVHVEELLRNEGLVCCSLCAWVGYPEVHPQGHSEKARRPDGTPRAADSGPPRGGAAASGSSRSGAAAAVVGSSSRSGAAASSSSSSWRLLSRTSQGRTEVKNTRPESDAEWGREHKNGRLPPGSVPSPMAVVPTPD